MFTAYIEKKIAAITATLVGLVFPEPIDTITGEMQESMDIHTLREVNVRMNGQTVGVCLSFCQWTGGRPYAVTGYTLDGKMFTETFDTQDEAEQEYIVRASYVYAAMRQAAEELGGELLNIGAKTHCLA